MDIMARNLDRVLLSSEAIDSTTAENVKLNNEVISASDASFYFLFKNRFFGCLIVWQRKEEKGGFKSWYWNFPHII